MIELIKTKNTQEFIKLFYKDEKLEQLYEDNFEEFFSILLNLDNKDYIIDFFDELEKNMNQENYFKIIFDLTDNIYEDKKFVLQKNIKLYFNDIYKVKASNIYIKQDLKQLFNMSVALTNDDISEIEDKNYIYLLKILKKLEILINMENAIPIKKEFDKYELFIKNKNKNKEKIFIKNNFDELQYDIDLIFDNYKEDNVLKSIYELNNLKEKYIIQNILNILYSENNLLKNDNANKLNKMSNSIYKIKNLDQNILNDLFFQTKKSFTLLTEGNITFLQYFTELPYNTLYKNLIIKIMANYNKEYDLHEKNNKINNYISNKTKESYSKNKNILEQIKKDFKQLNLNDINVVNDYYNNHILNIYSNYSNNIRDGLLFTLNIFDIFLENLNYNEKGTFIIDGVTKNVFNLAVYMGFSIDDLMERKTNIFFPESGITKWLAIDFFKSEVSLEIEKNKALLEKEILNEELINKKLENKKTLKI